MIARIRDEMAANPPRELVALISLLGMAVQEEPYKALVNKELSQAPDFAARKVLLEMGHFKGQDFLQLLHACGDGKGTSTTFVTLILRQLAEWGLISDGGTLFGARSFVDYQWNKQRIAMFATLKILDNVILGPSYVAHKYRQSVPAVFIEKNGDQYTGTGFLATNRGDAKKYVIVTAKHNIDPDEGITFRDFSEPEGVKYKPLTQKWVLHPKLDLALIPVECDQPAMPIYPVSMPSVLARTITLGYPRIATTDAPYLLAHGGELNAVVKNFYGEEHLIISNVVAPGNSGGPVLDDAGLCLGIVVNSFEAKHEGGVNKANAAIPAGAILDFIAPYCS